MAGILEVGDTIQFTGSLPPCYRCQGVMNKVALRMGVKITYSWPGAAEAWVSKAPATAEEALAAASRGSLVGAKAARELGAQQATRRSGFQIMKDVMKVIGEDALDRFNEVELVLQYGPILQPGEDRPGHLKNPD
jgi:hypothetical protein